MANEKPLSKDERAELEALRAKSARMDAAAKAGFTFRVSSKGALAVYGMGGKFPVQLHPDQWDTLLNGASLIREALKDHAADLVPLKTVLDAAKAAKSQPGQTAGQGSTIADNAVAGAAARMAARDATDPNHGK